MGREGGGSARGAEVVWVEAERDWRGGVKGKAMHGGEGPGHRMTTAVVAGRGGERQRARRGRKDKGGDGVGAAAASPQAQPPVGCRPRGGHVTGPGA